MSENLFHQTVLEKNFEFDKAFLFPHLSWLNLAYARRLEIADIISKDEYLEISKALIEVDREGVSQLDFISDQEDLVLHVESKLKAKIGNVAGKLHTGRSRNDMGHSLLRMLLREWILDNISCIGLLIEILLQHAETYKQTPFPAITHGQRAQTIPFAHYLLGFISVLVRDVKRLQNSYDEINISPMGAAALATSVWPIDRQGLCEDLAFDKVKINSYDCVSSVDSLLSYVGNIKTCSINLSRLIYDLHHGTAQETSWYIFSNKFVNRSSIMPQKRNPVVLEHLRGRFAVLISQCDVVANMSFNIPFGDVNDIDADLKHPTLAMVTSFLESSALLHQVLEDLKLNTEKCLRAVKEDFSNMTELADWLVLECGCTFRDAHKVVSNLVNEMLESNKTAKSINANLLKKHYFDVVGEKLKISSWKINRVLDPKRIIETRNNIGGTSLVRVEAQIADFHQEVLDINEFCREKIELISTSRENCFNL